MAEPRRPTILIDTNVLIDVLDRDPAWAEWSAEALRRAAAVGPLAINPVIYAELSVDFARIEHLEAALAELEIAVAEIPRRALFEAGKAFRSYRARGGGRADGTRGGVLPDFFIGAHARVLGVPLLTRDAGRYRTYFPGLELIAPVR
jgi:predicted nucleic acid-binding protein